MRGFEFSLAFDDGTVRHVLSTGLPLPDAEGRLRGSVLVLTGITERKQAEERIQQQVKDLQAVNEELARFNRLAVGREMRMIELKKEVDDLCKEAGKPPRYLLEFEKGPAA